MDKQKMTTLILGIAGIIVVGGLLWIIFGTTDIYNAVSEGNQVRVESFLRTKPALASAPDKNGDTALHYAAMKGHTRIAEILISNGADVNAQDKEGLTPLHIAAGIGHIEFVELLLAKGADVNRKDADGWTPLYMATKNNRTRVAEILNKANEKNGPPLEKKEGEKSGHRGPER
jgi:ankyrin repeat protein